MRRRDKEVADPRVVLDVLARGEVLHLAMIAGGAPYVVPLSYAALPGPEGAPLDGLRLLLHGAPQGRKIDALRADPRVCFEVSVDVAVLPGPRACAFTVRYLSVIGEGRARFVAEPGEKARALAVLAARHGAPGTTLEEAEVRGVCVVEVAVEAVSCKCSPPPPVTAAGPGPSPAGRDSGAGER